LRIRPIQQSLGYRETASSGGNSGGGSGGAAVEEKPVDKLIANKVVMIGFYCLFKANSYGNDERERAAWVMQVGDEYSFLRWPWNAKRDKAIWPTEIPANQVGIVHTHRNALTMPSDDDDVAAAASINKPVYNLTISGIWKVTPSGGSMKVADYNWWKPFYKSKQKCE
jgi:hypothetical protein